jgi:hypothetical protein
MYLVVRHDSLPNHGIDEAGADVMIQTLVELGPKPSHGFHGLWPFLLGHDPYCKFGRLLIGNAPAGLENDPAVMQAAGMAVRLGPLESNDHISWPVSDSGSSDERLREDGQ